MAGFMKSAMSYLGMTDVAEGDEDFNEEAESSETSFDSDHSVTPMASTPAATSAPREQTKANPFQGGRVSRITTIHPKSYEDAQLVGRAIRDGVPVVLNLTGVPRPWHIALWTFPRVWFLACVAPSNVSLRACSC